MYYQQTFYTNAESKLRENTEAKDGLLFNWLPDEILRKIFSFCDSKSLEALALTGDRMRSLAMECKMSESEDDEELEVKAIAPNLQDFPSEVLISIFSYLDVRSIGRVSQVCSRFRALCYSDCLWTKAARNCLFTGDVLKCIIERTAKPLCARERVRISKNWIKGKYLEKKLLVQNQRFMPRLQLERDILWVSWGQRIWAHPRHWSDGTIDRKTTKVLKGHSDDVSSYLVRDGLLVSGGRDASIVAWNATNGDFLFAKRYCHGGEVSALDFLPHNELIVSGSRDRTIKFWSLSRMHCLDNSVNGCNNNHHNVGSFPALLKSVNIGDRIWSLSANPVNSKLVIGSAGHGGIPALHLMDFEADSSSALIPFGMDILKKGAGTLDINWYDENTFLSGGYDSCTRMWDIRTGGLVRTWEEPFNEAIYCLSTDKNFSLVCGTARHCLVRLWDMRNCKHHVQMFYARHAHSGQSSPVYSVAFDLSNLYVALDQCLNLMSFTNGQKATTYNIF